MVGTNPIEFLIFWLANFLNVCLASFKAFCMFIFVLLICCIIVFKSKIYKFWSSDSKEKSFIKSLIFSNPVI